MGELIRKLIRCMVPPTAHSLFATQRGATTPDAAFWRVNFARVLLSERYSQIGIDSRMRELSRLQPGCRSQHAGRRVSKTEEPECTQHLPLLRRRSSRR